jgi:ferredoxin
MITGQGLSALVAELVGAGVLVTAPARSADGKVDYRPVNRLDEAVLDGALPRRSLKELFLPPTEPLFSFRMVRSDVEIGPVPTSFPPHVILGARPCDAAGVEILDKVMGWDYRDELWFGRREATTIVSIVCKGLDGSCFCKATGHGPDSRRGADLLLTPMPEGFAVEVVTPKGEAFVSAHAAQFGAAPDAAAVEERRRALCGTRAEPVTAPLAGVGAWLAEHFEDPLWNGLALRCHGCGACASVCPTCHCFDIVDEPDGVTHGTRRRNWDTCQTGRFTLHASGHNPRTDQNARFRQRVMHKFSIYPARFGEVLCTGCGRCSRACPGGMDLPEVLQKIGALAVAAAPGAGGGV